MTNIYRERVKKECQRIRHTRELAHGELGHQEDSGTRRIRTSGELGLNLVGEFGHEFEIVLL